MRELKLTDADLAKLEEMAAHYASGNALPFADDAYRESACNATPALVAEVRRLRAERAQLCAAEDDLK